DGKLGKTASSALPWRTAALRAAISLTSRVQATVRSWSRYIFRLVASSVVAGRDMSAAAAQFVVAEDLDFGGGRGRLVEAVGEPFPGQPANGSPDRKSTRLNSSHVSISYAVFCLKKKYTNIL